MNVALVTAIYGGRDRPKSLPTGWRLPAHLYTDDPDLVAPAAWTVHHEPLDELPGGTTPRMRAKWWKLNPHLVAPDADVVIWLDASITITVKQSEFIKHVLDALGDDDVAVTQHPERTCIYDEAVAAAHLDPRVTAQAAFYRDAVVHPARWGLWATGVMAWRLNDRTRALSKHWWDDLVNHSERDQVSLPVLLRILEQRDGLRWNGT